MARRVRHRYRVRPRLFIVVGVLLAAAAYIFWPRPPKGVTAPPARTSRSSAPASASTATFSMPPLGWFAGKALPQPAEGLATVTAVGDLLAVGGSNGSTSSTAITAYGPSPLAVSLPDPVHDASVVVRRSVLYVLGGGTAVPTTTVQAISLTGQAVSSPPELSAPLSDAVSVDTPDGFVFVGGYTGTSELDTVDTWSGGKRRVRARLPLALRYAAAAWYHHRLIVAGGLTVSGVSNKVFSVNLATGRVTTWPALPDPVYHAGLAVYHGDLVLVGGTVNGSATAATWVYDPPAGKWVKGPPLPSPTSDGSLAVYRGELWYLGGYTTGGATASVWIGRPT